MSEFLFCDARLSDALGAQMSKAIAAANELAPRRLLERGIEELAADISSQYEIRAVEFQTDGISADQVEVDIDVSGDPNRRFLDRSRPHYLKGTRITYYIPFTGYEGLLKLQPSTFTTVYPTGRIQSGELVVVFEGVSLDGQTVKAEFQRNLESARRYLGWQKPEVDRFNTELEAQVQGVLATRLTKINADDALIASLGVPIRRRQDAPTTYVTPTIRRKPDIPSRAARSAGSPLEPVLAFEEYEHILSVVQNMVAVIERSPATFKGMQEEDLRNHLLVQLNGQYEGQATGETFNASGKTDILIRVKDRNVFVAECKFWDGAKALLDAMDQLLGYLTWRDTKAAIFLFNRKRKLSTVLAAIPGAVRSHPAFVRPIPYGNETGFRFVLARPDDPDREMTMTILVFETPS